MEVLIWRRPKVYDPPMGGQWGRWVVGWDTIVLARGERDAMLKRWDIADKRLRAYGLKGHVEVRDEADPKVPQDHYWTPGTTPESWLAIMEGDTVVVRIYGNTYGAIVTKATIKGIEARFSARTRKGGWGGESPTRVRPFPLRPTPSSTRAVERVSKLVPQP